MKMCSKCGIHKPLSEFHSAGNSGRYKRKQCKECRSIDRKEKRMDCHYLENERRKRREWHTKAGDRYFIEVINGYGGKCLECGEDRPEALLIHHLVGSRRGEGGTKTSYLAKIIRDKFPPDKILLCGTCHLILHRGGKFNATRKA